MKVGIVIPAYNEERRIEKTLKEYLAYFDKIERVKKIKYKLLVSVNATTDNTLNIVKKYVKKNKNLNYINLVEGGKGNAVIQGFKYFIKEKYDLIGFVDADLATKPEQFNELIKSINGYDGIIADRYIKGSIVNPKPTIARKTASRIFNMAIRSILLLPYRDTQCGAKLFKRAALEKVIPNLSLSQWAFDVDLIYSLRKLNFTVKELPTVWSDMQYSKINFMKSGPMMLLGVIRLRLINSPFKVFSRVYDLSVLLANKLTKELI